MENNIKDIRVYQLNQFLERRRPPLKIRDKLDLGYKINGQEIIIHEIRPSWHDKNQKIEPPIARTTYVKSRNIWKIYWMRANLKWYLYEPDPEVNTLAEFLKIVDEDRYGCFWG